jgi:hypothetical protein
MKNTLNSSLAALHAAEPKIFDITAYGAKGDGTTMNTTAKILTTTTSRSP